MKEPTLEEVNRGISDFMFPEFKVMKHIPESYVKCGHYTESLDALVPVWDKAGLNITNSHSSPEVKGKDFTQEQYIEVELRDAHDVTYRGKGKTIQEAAAISTYKAIKELKDE